MHPGKINVIRLFFRALCCAAGGHQREGHSEECCRHGVIACWESAEKNKMPLLDYRIKSE